MPPLKSKDTSKKSRVAIVQSNTKGPYQLSTIKNLIQQAFSLMGGVRNQISSIMRVLIKPNQAFKIESPTTTNPLVIQGLLQVLQEAGIPADNLVVGESSVAGFDTDEVMEYTGLRKVVEQEGVRCIDFNKFPRRKTEVLDGKVYKMIELPESYLDADLVISVPAMKTHVNTMVSLGLKNMKGLLTSHQKRYAHMTDLPNAIAELATVGSPQLVLVDGLIGVEGLGPDSPPGVPVDQGLIILGNNAIATDAVTASVMGFNVSEIDHLRLAHERGCGPIDLSLIETLGLSVELVKAQHKWDHPPKAMKEIALLKYTDDVVDGSPCSACVGGVFWVLTLMDQKGETSKLKGWTLAMGSKAKKGLQDLSLKNKKLLVIGRCCKSAATWGEKEGAKVVFVPGCPPTPAEFNQMLAELGASSLFD